jgi:CheY-like chemotaxis protein
VIEAEDSKQAVRLAAEAMPAVILMDLGLPRMDGWEATRLIKAVPRTAHVPVLALTGHAFRDSIVRGKSTGVDAFFIKPVPAAGRAGEDQRDPELLDEPR